ncbi:hypothetical protein [Micromonospora halophytica]|uniref:Uncharacterized protein n=1 Tax=Micromonospora halophytica TaxID=47864 RepID=A0A1C5IF41_9ACTN|nr:hypothetical protein [Micromonospora halophytica]SCG56673.1 hypothetical protein GA0070560_110149 [Micromonospora halophytica]
MRLTVGPLPSAVYWRRRAVVLGAGLLFLIVVLYSCNGADDTAKTPGAKSTSSASAVEPSDATPTPDSVSPSAGPDGPGPSGGPAGGSGTPAAPPPADPPVAPVGGSGSDAGACTDAEITVTAVARPSVVPPGNLVDLQLRVKNKSQRTCSRDVGADLQELFIKSGAERVWSSDTCGTGKGSDVQSFTPGFERLYQLTWNGRDVSKCADGVAAGPTPPPGPYQVFARVGSKLSEPVKLTIAAN